MDGKDSVGRRISLLNDNADASAPPNRLPSLEPGLRSRTSSYTSTPCLSPQTPQLLRSDSTDSVTMTSPSPVTPTFGFDDAHSPTVAPMPYFMGAPTMQKEAMLPYAMPPQPYAHPGAANVFIRPPGTERHPMPPSNPKTKKNQYPCPLAKQYNCSDFFTTSGHAARHAKKHTGKKDAICPDCHKAFTRKDNMEQHRRTHQSGRNSRIGSKDGEDSRAKKPKTAQRPRPSPLQSSEASSMCLVDPSLPASPASSFGVAPAVQPADVYVTSPYSETMTYPPPERFQLAPSPYDMGLQTLALACGEKRKYEA
ncbi:hypothetical protein K490DRAFT_55676 [Saccharata proteae CBS 121410]|uniref:C2H2 type master regulator of conidiophore development brlA n=1 Tax=Saccharata proteae CBS 121410 TaxID=1314787 RepID=A0A6A5YB32_9PEZI|nr:hypothetical protein K490DRAFT_55676 [Saccharata proteae CBS 121410]